jgi:hypothetical protein
MSEEAHLSPMRDVSLATWVTRQGDRLRGERSMALWYPHNPTVRDVQAAFKGIGLVSCEKCMEQLGRIIDENLWATYKTTHGVLFGSFPQWVVQTQPEGLGVNNQRSAEFLRKLLIDAGRIGTWALILDYISVKPGRPENLVDDDIFRPFYRVSTASSALDRMLRRLMLERPDLLAQVTSEHVTVRAAALKAGMIKPNSGAIPIMKMVAGFKRLDSEEQVGLLELLWSHMDLSARQRFRATHDA